MNLKPGTSQEKAFLFFIPIRCSLPAKSRECEKDKKLFLWGYGTAQVLFDAKMKSLLNVK